MQGKIPGPFLSPRPARQLGTIDGILIPPGAWHTITATETLRFFCCCAPPYAHEDTYFE
ncbi:MAG: hypothetical protein ACO1QR_00425 [Chthoniobacteraceae bacterium]